MHNIDILNVSNWGTKPNLSVKCWCPFLDHFVLDLFACFAIFSSSKNKHTHRTGTKMQLCGGGRWGQRRKCCKRADYLMHLHVIAHLYVINNCLFFSYNTFTYINVYKTNKLVRELPNTKLHSPKKVAQNWITTNY